MLESSRIFADRLRRSAFAFPLVALAALAMLLISELSYWRAGESLDELGQRAVARTTLERLLTEGGRITGALVKTSGASEVLAADAYVVALGSYTPLLLRPLGIRLPVYPAKGYSATLALTESSVAPTVALTDDGHKLVFSRLGQRLRIAGTAEFNGYNTELNSVRCQALMQRTHQLFPDLRAAGEPDFWCGLRPSTPSNVPFIGRSVYSNLYLNTGHGTLGWTMACGSGSALADIIGGRSPEIRLRRI